MIDWWLNLRWAAETHREKLAKIDVATLLIAATVALALAFRG